MTNPMTPAQLQAIKERLAAELRAREVEDALFRWSNGSHFRRTAEQREWLMAAESAQLRFRQNIPTDLAACVAEIERLQEHNVNAELHMQATLKRQYERYREQLEAVHADMLMRLRQCP